jgi:hypothetical protein
MFRYYALALALSVSSCTYDFSVFGNGGSDAGGASSTTSLTGAAGAVATSSDTASSSGVGGGSISTSSVSASATGGSTPIYADCKAIKEADDNATDGIYTIDPDEQDVDPPFDVYCDMTTNKGGWTRFNWIGEPYPTGTDPLEFSLSQCGVGAMSCRGRIPAAANPTELLVKEANGEFARWTFDGSNVATRVLEALRDKVEVCISNVSEPAWVPDEETSTEDFCADQPGGCDAFKYTNTGCNGTMGWVLELDDDSHECRAAFKLGRTTPNDPCGLSDWAFLDDCDCDDEYGGLYYR